VNDWRCATSLAAPKENPQEIPPSCSDVNEASRVLLETYCHDKNRNVPIFLLRDAVNAVGVESLDNQSNEAGRGRDSRPRPTKTVKYGDVAPILNKDLISRAAVEGMVRSNNVSLTQYPLYVEQAIEAVSRRKTE
jgi:hypothetical protein